MKKIIACLITVALMASVCCMSFAALEGYEAITAADMGGTYTSEYSIPLAAVVPTIDGDFSENEWLGAYKTSVNPDIMGDFGGIDTIFVPSYDVFETSIATYDTYMMWFEGSDAENYGFNGTGGLYICVVANDTDPGNVIEAGSASNGPQDGIQFALSVSYNGVDDDNVFIFDFAATSVEGRACSYEHSAWNSECQFVQVASEYNHQYGYSMEIFIPWIALNTTNPDGGFFLPDFGVGTSLKAGIVYKDGGGNSSYFEGSHNIAAFNYLALDFGEGKDLSVALSSRDNLDTITLAKNTVGADLSALYEEIYAVDLLNPADYTPATWAPLAAAYETAKTYTGLTTQADVDALVETMKTLRGALAISHVLEGIEITVEPTKKFYNMGEELDLNGLVVTGSFADGTTETISDYAVTGFSSAALGTVTVTVSYETFSDTFEISVYLLGDVTGDSVITTADARSDLLAALGSISLSEIAAIAADTNNDGIVTTADARLVLLTALG